MSVKLLSIATAALMFSTMAQASNTGIIRFTGAITDATCNLIPTDDSGSASADIDLGTVAAVDLTDTNPSSTAVTFSLVPSPGSPPECMDGTKTTEVGFNGNYNVVGLANESGTAGNTSVKLEGETAAGWHSYTSNTQNAELKTETGTGAINFRAAMTKSTAGVPAVAGTVITQATYSVIYK